VAQTEEEQRRDDPTSPSLETAASTEPAPTPAQEPSGKAFEVPSPLKAAGSGPAAAPKLQVSKPEGANLSLIVFILLVVLALGAVGAVILAAFF
jgi:uncharacterized protein HemX